MVCFDGVNDFITHAVLTSKVRADVVMLALDLVADRFTYIMQ